MSDAAIGRMSDNPLQVRYSARVLDRTGSSNPSMLTTVHLVATDDDYGCGSGHILHVNSTDAIRMLALEHCDEKPYSIEPDSAGGFSVELARARTVDGVTFTGLSLPMSIEESPRLLGASDALSELAFCDPMRDFTVVTSDGQSVIEPVMVNISLPITDMLMRQMQRLDELWPQRHQTDPGEFTLLYASISSTVRRLVQQSHDGCERLPRMYVSNLLRWTTYCHFLAARPGFTESGELYMPAAVLKPFACDLLVATGRTAPGIRNYEA